MVALLYVLVLFGMVQTLSIASWQAGTIDWVQGFMPSFLIGGLICFCLVLHAIGALWRWSRRSGSTFDY